ncbi:radical SAM protein [Pseudodesulfovibrio sp. F-1]|uniref:Radical SAM protein n=1 Tax=Pseudodesulfovibrio alkaliphilus TaxID=2661613 RepID=A0A7K1KPI0_9BACT|nr:NifB/NifX family molybdenum-iron cluster-binding protein [Pseudodesulfovibrio alkaliphilus]MUM77993.1 radical SAM protein [Pseudodesulfovibrio alkaliphilus]
MAISAKARASHPCFGPSARRSQGRVHLPVAPRAVARTRFVPESVTAPSGPVMTPEEALAMLDLTVADGASVGMAGITGPGDPMATPEATLQTLRLVRAKYPDLPLCLTTLGLGLAPLAGDLAAIGLSHVTLLVDAVSAEVAEGVYAWIRPSTRTVPLPLAAQMLVEEQRKAVKALVEAGVTVKVNVTVHPEVNDDHIETISRTMAGLGASIMTVVPRWTDGESGVVRPDMDLLAAVREKAARYMVLTPSWGECGDVLAAAENPQRASLPRPAPGRPNVAVASAGGMDVDLHLGHAARLLVYGPREDGLACLLETRDAPEPGGGDGRWEALAETLSDCFVLLAASAGERPREILSRRGVAVLITEDGIEGTVDALYGGGRKGKGCNTAKAATGGALHKGE